MVQSFKEQAEFWIQNGFVEDLLRIKGNVGQFIKELDEKPPSARAKKSELAGWAGLLSPKIRKLFRSTSISVISN